MEEVRIFQKRQEVLIQNEQAIAKWIPDEGLVSLSQKRTGRIVVRNASVGVRTSDGLFSSYGSLLRDVAVHEVKDKIGKGKCLASRFYSANGNITMDVFITLYVGCPFLTIELSVQNKGRDELEILELYPLIIEPQNGGELFEGSSQELSILKNGWGTWSPTLGLRSWQRDVVAFDEYFAHHSKQLESGVGRTSGEIVGEWMGALKNWTTNDVLVVGSVTMDKFFTRLYFSLQNCDREAFRLYSAVDTEHYRLAPGQTITSGRFFIDCCSGLEQALSTYASVVQKTMGSLGWNRQVTGWTSWYYYYENVTEDDILRNLDFLAKNRETFPIEYIQIDDGYQKNIGDWLSTNKSRFPHGMKWIADRIKESGFRPGIWVAPFLVSQDSELYRSHVDWLIKDSTGNPVSAGRYHNSDLYGLDCTHPGVMNWLEYVFATIIEEWGYEFLKLDFLYSGALEGLFHDRGSTRLQACRQGLKIIRRIADQEFVLACGCPLGAGIGLVNGMRIGPDVSADWRNLEATKWSASAENSIRNILNRYFLHHKLWLNDPDALIARQKASNLTLDETRSLATAIGLSGGILFLGDNMQELEQDRKVLLSKFLPPYGETAVARDMLVTETPSVFDLVVREAFGEWHVVGLFNWADGKTSMSLDLALLGLPTGGKEYHVYEFWEERYCGKVTDTISFDSVAPHGVKLLSVRPVLSHPFLLSTDVHFTQGATEISDARWDDQNLKLVIVLADVFKRTRGRVLLYVPDRYEIERPSSRNKPVLMSQVGPNVLALEISNAEITTIEVRFSELKKGSSRGRGNKP